MTDENEIFDRIIEASTEYAVRSVTNSAEQLADAFDSYAVGLDYMQTVALKLLRAVFANTLIASRDDVTEAELQQFYEAWFEEATAELRVSPETVGNLMGMRDTLQKRCDEQEG